MARAATSKVPKKAGLSGPNQPPPQPAGAAAYDRWDESTSPSVTVYWGGVGANPLKRMNLNWIDYKRTMLVSPPDGRHALRMLFADIEVRCSMDARSDYPLPDLMRDIANRCLYGLFDLPQRGFRLSVFQLVKTPAGMSEEEL